MTSGLHHFYVNFIHSQNYLEKVHKQDPTHHLCLFSYLYILVLHCYFVDLCLFLEDYIEILPTHPPLPLHTATWLQVWLCSHAELHFTELGSLNYEKKIEASKRQIALKFTPAAKAVAEK